MSSSGTVPPSSHSPPRSTKKMTIARLSNMAIRRRPIAMLTAYDYPSARRARLAGSDVVLVGDSLAQVALGYDSTTRLKMDEMVHHTRAVRRALGEDALENGPFVVVDMPFGSYHTGLGDALKNAVRLVQEGGAEAVKLEGGEEILEIVRSLVRIGIPVVGHIGLCPQRHTASSGYRVQGKDAHSAYALLQRAQALRRAGACMLVLEAMPHQVATHITSQIVPPAPSPKSALIAASSDTEIGASTGDARTNDEKEGEETRQLDDHGYPLAPLPTIGIGAGPGTSGQVLVQDDMLGFWGGHRPRFVRQFLPSLATLESLVPPAEIVVSPQVGLVSEPLSTENMNSNSVVPEVAPAPRRDVSLGTLALEAASAYVDAVHARTFPSIEGGEVYGMDPKEWAGYLKLVESAR